MRWLDILGITPPLVVCHVLDRDPRSIIDDVFMSNVIRMDLLEPPKATRKELESLSSQSLHTLSGFFVASIA